MSNVISGDCISFELGKGGLVKISILTDFTGVDEEVVKYIELRDLTNLVRDFNERHRANG